MSPKSGCAQKRRENEPSEPFAPILSTLEESLVRLKDGKMTAHHSMHTSLKTVKDKEAEGTVHSPCFDENKIVAASELA